MKELIYIHTTKINSQKANLLQVLAMCNAFINNDVKVTLYLPKEKKEETSVPSEYEINSKINLKFYIINKKIPSVLRYSKGIKKVLNLYSKNKIFFIRNFSLAITLYQKGYNFIFESHNYKLHSNPIIDTYFKIYLKKIAKKANLLQFITISGELYKYWIKFGIPKNKISYYHDGVDINMFKKVLSKEDALKRLNIPNSGKIRVVYSGSLYGNRNLFSIIDIASKYPDIEFVIVGGPNSEIPKLKKYSDKKNVYNVSFVGWVPHKLVPIYLFSSDILLAIWSRKVDTINYCSPLKVFEYMAAERIIIAHAFPTIKEVLNSSNAILVNPDDYKKLESSISIAIKKLKDRSLAKKARTDVINKYTWLKRAKYIKELI